MSVITNLFARERYKHTPPGGYVTQKEISFTGGGGFFFFWGVLIQCDIESMSHKPLKTFGDTKKDLVLVCDFPTK